MPVPVIVLNFGHSVLKSLEDYTQAASEIYRHYRQGKNVVAVTSAQGDQTDVLLAEARRIGPEGVAKNLPELVHLGERKSPSLVVGFSDLEDAEIEEGIRRLGEVMRLQPDPA